MSFSETSNPAKFLDIENVNFLPVLNQLDDGIIITDINGTILFYNQAQSRIDGLAPEDVIGLKVTDIYEMTDQTSMVMLAIYRNTAIRNRTLLYRTISGKIANTVTSVYPIFNGETVAGVICLVKDYELLYRSTSISTITENRPDMGNGTQYTFSDLIGSGEEFQRVVATARKAAFSSSPVMIQGETGTGKELFSQSIHNQSPRRNQNFLAINCAAIPHDLLEGILFGTTRGTYTGSIDKTGLFETANGGTLFLDEILAMTVELQAKLLRVIQEKRIRPLGSLREIPVDVKIISSINQDPRTAIHEGLLRTDLFYRLGVVMVKLPPLRERAEDMDDLINHFIKKHNARLGTQVKNISREALDLFKTHQWPGNIRELEHLIEGAMNIAGREKRIGIEHFTQGLSCLEQNDLSSRETVFSSSKRSVKSSYTESEPLLDPAAFTTLAQQTAIREKTAVKSALAASGGNVTLAAKHLGISRQLLHYKIKKYKLFRADFIKRPIV